MHEHYSLINVDRDAKQEELATSPGILISGTEPIGWLLTYQDPRLNGLVPFIMMTKV